MLDKMREKWSEFFDYMYELEKLSYARCVKPSGAVEDPMLIIFSGGCSTAYEACTYVRWSMRETFMNYNRSLLRTGLLPPRN